MYSNLCMLLRNDWEPSYDSFVTVCRFTYQLLQGYDFVHLNREHGVRLQVVFRPLLNL